MLGTAQLTSNLHRRPHEHLVSVRTDVLSDAEHAVGNMLQRIHHMARVAGDGPEPEGERLRRALTDLERLLELVFDYVSPVQVEVCSTPAERVAESLAAQVRAHGSGEVTIGECPALRLLADPRALSRSFLLLGRACGKAWEQSTETAIEVRCDEGHERVEFVIRASGGAAPAPDANLAVAVAARLIELQGGELHWSPASCPFICSVVLPTSQGVDGSA